MPSLAVNVEKKEATCIVTVNGSLDTVTYTIFEEKTKDIDPAETKAVMLDMAGVDYISSMGLSAIMKLRKKIESGGGGITLANLQPRIKKVFEVAKIIPDIVIFKSRVEADMYLDKIQRGEE